MINQEIPTSALTSLFKHFDSITSFTEEEKNEIQQALIFRKLKKNEHIKNEFDVSNKFFFVVRGVLRSYIVNQKEAEHTAQFVTDNQWIGDYTSFDAQKPTRLKIQALTETHVLVLPYKKREEFIEKMPSFFKYNCHVMEHMFADLRNRMLDNLSMAAEDKYNHFCENNPDLVRAISQKYIASFLGITPEFFSAMKKRLKVKKTA